FFQAEDGIRDATVTGVQTCALPISYSAGSTMSRTMTSFTAITARLAADGIVVKEVMVRDIVLPAEYAKGLEGLLLKEQENERLEIGRASGRGREKRAEGQEGEEMTE